jgi:hypothetical protein
MVALNLNLGILLIILILIFIGFSNISVFIELALLMAGILYKIPMVVLLSSLLVFLAICSVSVTSVFTYVTFNVLFFSFYLSLGVVYTLLALFCLLQITTTVIAYVETTIMKLAFQTQLVLNLFNKTLQLILIGVSITRFNLGVFTLVVLCLSVLLPVIDTRGIVFIVSAITAPSTLALGLDLTDLMVVFGAVYVILNTVNVLGLNS